MKKNEVLKHIREKLGMTQVQIAKKLHMVQGNYSSYESGSLEMSWEKFFSLMRKFSIKIKITIEFKDGEQVNVEQYERAANR